MTWLRAWLMNRDLDAKLRKRRMIRAARSEAAQRGVSTEWRRRREACERVFG